MERSLEQKVERVLNALKELQMSSNTESAHKDADEWLCYLLEELGYEDVVEEYEKIDKWYS